MAEQDKQGNPARERIWNDSAEGLSVQDTGREHSPEAMKILIEQGVEAYRAYLARHR